METLRLRALAAALLLLGTGPGPGAGEDSHTLPLGPIGGGGRLSSGTNSIRVTAVTAGAPGAAAGLQAGDYLHGAFGEEFGVTGGAGISGAELDLGLAIERAEANGGQLPLKVLRGGAGDLVLTVNLPDAGVFGPAYPLNSPKFTAVHDRSCQRIHEKIQASGIDPFVHSWAAIGLLGHPNWNDTAGARPYRNSIDKVRDALVSMINQMTYAPVEDKLFDGSNNPNHVDSPVSWENWKLGGSMIFLTQYRLKTGDASVDDELQRGAELIANRVQWWKQPALGTSYSPAGSAIAGMVSHSGVTGDYIHLGWGGGINICGSQNFSGLAAAKSSGLVDMSVRPRDGHYFGYDVAPAGAVASGMEAYDHSLTEKLEMCWNWMVGPCGGWSAGDFGDGHVCYTTQGWSTWDAAGRTAAALFGMMLYSNGGSGLGATDADRVARMKGYLVRNYARLQECHAYTHGGQVYYQLCMPYLDDRGQRYVMENWRAHHNLSRQPDGTLSWVPGRNMDDTYLDREICSQTYAALPGTIANGGLPGVPGYNTDRILADFKSPWLTWPTLEARRAKVTLAAQPFTVDICDGSGNVLTPGSYTAAWTHVSGPATATFSDPAAASTTVTFPTPGRYRIQLAATSGSRSITEPIDVDAFFVSPPAGYVQGVAGYEVFTGLSGNNVSDLTSSAKFTGGLPDAVGTLAKLEGSWTGETYGQRIRGYIIPPADGQYRFHLSSDDASQFKFNSAGPAETSSVAINLAGAVTRYTWTAQSALFTLAAGQPYFFEVLHKEGTGGDHVAVAWTGPNIPTPAVVPGHALAMAAANGIVRQPAAQEAPPGGSATFSVMVSGPGPFLYQWRLDGVPCWGHSTSATLSLTNIGAGAAGMYDCVVTVPGGTITSAAAPLSLTASATRTRGGLKREVWNSLGGSAVTDLTGSANYPNFPSSTGIVTSAESAENYGDSFGQKLSGWLCPPATGDYRFFLTSDDASQLWLSTDDTAANAALLAEVTAWKDFRAYGSGAKSAPVRLTAGERYYLEVLHKEGGGGDHLSLAWQPPGEAVPADGSPPIDGTCLEYEQFLPLMVDRWKLDEASGTTAANSIRALNGTHTNGPLVNQPGAAATTGRAVAYDGADDRTRIAAPDYHTNTLTMVAWARRNGTQAAWAPILFCRGGNTVAGFGCGTANDLRYHWEDAHHDWNPSLTLPDGEWVLAALVVTPTQATMHMRTAAGLQSATHTATHNVEEFDGDLNIGADTAQGGRRFKGRIDDVRVYKAALTAAQIEEIYTSGLNSAPQVAAAAMSVPENSTHGTTVGTVTASDPDPGQTLTYSIAGGNLGGRFAIDPTTGTISLETTLDRESIPAFALTVRVTDDGAPALSTDATVTITVNDLPGDDSDSDGLPDEWELAHFGSTHAAHPADDPDGDGLDNAGEVAAGTNPLLTDTDGDGFRDPLELAVGTSPADESAVPDASYGGLVGWWRMDDGGGGTARDSSGHGRHAALTVAPAWVAGRSGGGLNFDGATHYLTVSGFTTPAALTIAAWIRPDSVSGTHTMLSQNASIAFRTEGSGLRLTTPGVRDHDTGSVPITAGAWQHVAVTFTPGAVGGAKFYLNGTLEATLDASGMNRTSNAWWLGKAQWANQLFDGVLDDVRLYDRALGAAELAVVAANPDANGNGILDEWEIARFGNADPGANPPDADADGDGTPNLLEYAFGTDPTAPDACPMTCDFANVAGDGHLRLTVARNPAATNLAYQVQASGTLEPDSWSDAGIVIEEDLPDRLVARDPVPVSAAARRFMRVRVEVVTQP